MALVVRNPNLALTPAMKAAGGQVVMQIGTMMIKKGKQMFWNGVRWVTRQAYNAMVNGGTRRGITQAGALTGAVVAPVAVARIVRGSKPKFRKGVGSVTISHRELLGQWNNSPGLVVNQGVADNIYRVNPSNGVLFPWLQTLASNFDQYTFGNVSLQYVPLCSTTETGRVAMYFDKDSQDLEPADRVELASMAHLTETSAWAEATLNIPTDGLKRFTDDSATADPKLLDLGQIGVATYGGSGTNPVGDIFIRYTITFHEPQASSGLVSTIQTGTGSVNSGPTIVSVSGSDTSTTVTFRGPGTFYVNMGQRATALANVGNSAGTTVSSITNASNGTIYTSTCVIIVNTAGGTITYTGTAFGNYTLNVTRTKRVTRTNII
uniref:Capsid protein n=1 Tax=Elderberry aureusvirus 1 TaxID=2304214 RepID=A0A346LR29_9TOMB|nr:coat protein [Elderberry aureusvirus 1]